MIPSSLPVRSRLSFPILIIVLTFIRFKVVILVANKADLVRNREIKSTKGKQLAIKYGVKYIETSPGMRYFYHLELGTKISSFLLLTRYKS